MATVASVQVNCSVPRSAALELYAYVLITENNRLETAAAAIVQRMTNRRRPRVFLPVIPLKKGSSVTAVMMVVVKESV
jgi:hypothetical protein